MMASTATRGPRHAATAARLCGQHAHAVRVVGAVGQHQRRARPASAGGRARPWPPAPAARPPRRGGRAAGAPRPRPGRVADLVQRRRGHAPSRATTRRRRPAAASRRSPAASRSTSTSPGVARPASACGHTKCGRAPAAAAACSASGSRPSSGPNTASPPLMTAAFSAKISLARVAQHLVCSRPMLVSTTTGARRPRWWRPDGRPARPPGRPPRRRSRAKASERRHGEHLELRGLAELGGQRRPPRRARAPRRRPAGSSSTGRPATSTRSFQPEMCGER